MSITDELRTYARGYELIVNHKLLKIADRIDAEADDNERFRRDVEPFCDRLREAAAERADVTIYGVDYVALPVDADGLPIHIGDRMENNERVVRVVLTDGSWEPSVYVGNPPNVLHEYSCNEISHYHEPTVEDLLREFAEKITDSQIPDVRPTYEESIAEYSAKFRLANDGEEHE